MTMRSLIILPQAKPLTRSPEQRRQDSCRQHVLIDTYLAQTAWGGSLRMRGQLHTVPLCHNAAFMGFSLQSSLSVTCLLSGRLLGD